MKELQEATDALEHAIARIPSLGDWLEREVGDEAVGKQAKDGLGSSPDAGGPAQKDTNISMIDLFSHSYMPPSKPPTPLLHATLKTPDGFGSQKLGDEIIKYWYVNSLGKRFPTEGPPERSL